MRSVTFGITGASGMPIALNLLKHLLLKHIKIHLVITTAGIITLNQELKIKLSANPDVCREVILDYLHIDNKQSELVVYTNNDWFAPIASGSSVSDSMVICPCSMATLGKLSGGIGDDLLTRAADVILKERKNLVLVPRETPLSAIHLENMVKLSRLGVSILPPVPAFYNHPESVQDIIDFIVSRILDQLGVSNQLTSRWPY